jgi:hypothetical protein
LWKNLAAFAFLAICPIPLLAGEVPDVKTVLAAWQQRQEGVRSARFTWTESRTLKAGAVVNRQMAESLRERFAASRTSKAGADTKKADADGHNPPGGIIPKNDVTFSVTHKLVFDADKMRYEYNGKIWDAEKGDPVDQDLISVWDGETPKSLAKSVAFGNPRGWVQKSARNMDLWQVHTIPLLLLYRPFHPELRDVNWSNMTVSDEQSIIAGKRCFALQQKINQQKGVVLLVWIADQSDYLIMRSQKSVNGTIISQYDFSYSADEEHGEVPTGWKYVSMSPGGAMKQSSTAVVREREWNRPIDPTEFQLAFPPGTFVSDLKHKRGEPGEFYIVREDKSNRPVSRPELVNNSYDQLVSADRGWGRSKLLILLIANGVFIIAIIVGWRLRKRLFRRC